MTQVSPTHLLGGGKWVPLNIIPETLILKGLVKEGKSIARDACLPFGRFFYLSFLFVTKTLTVRYHVDWFVAKRVYARWMKVWYVRSCCSRYRGRHRVLCPSRIRDEHSPFGNADEQLRACRLATSGRTYILRRSGRCNGSVRDAFSGFGSSVHGCRSRRAHRGGSCVWRDKTIEEVV